MAIKNLTFVTGEKFASDVQLMLCFTPEGGDLYKTKFPIVWKVVTIKAGGPDTVITKAQWSDAFAVFDAKIASDTNKVAARQYLEIKRGQTTSIKNGEWTNAIEWDGDKIRAINENTGPVDIGAGFIVNDKVNPMGLVNKAVAAGQALFPEYKPVLSAYIGRYFQENEIVKSEEKVKLVSRIDLSDAALGDNPTIRIYKHFRSKANSLSDSDDSFGILPSSGVRESLPMTVMYHATLSFREPYGVQTALESILRDLVLRGYYDVKVAKQNGTEARIEMVIPPFTTCHQAERAIMNCPYVPGWMFMRIENHTGQMLDTSMGNASFWLDIDPNSAEWFVNKEKVFDFGSVVEAWGEVQAAIADRDAKRLEDAKGVSDTKESLDHTVPQVSTPPEADGNGAAPIAA